MLYVGRIVCVGMTPSGLVCAGYRVSSRSFPNRRAVAREYSVSIIPKPGHETDVEKNPYIAYNCARIVRGAEVAVVTNGSQTDPIAQKIDAGMPIRDALALCLLALDYEHDAYNTPRICAVADRTKQTGWLATVREDGLNICRMPLSPRTLFYVATYEENDLSEARCVAFDAETPHDACSFLLGGGIFAQRTHPVTSVSAVANYEGFSLAHEDAPAP